MVCQHPDCDNRDTYPLIDNTNGKSKKFHLCETHHQEAKKRMNAGASLSGEKLDEQVEKLFGPQYKGATFGSFQTSLDYFEAVRDQLEGSRPEGKGLTIEEHVDNLKRAKKSLLRFTRNQLVKNGEGSVVLGGSEGVGKTHLAAACVRCLVGVGYEAAVWHATRLLTQIRATYSGSPSEEQQSIERLITRMTSPDVLVLEDIRPSCFADDMQDYIFSVVDRIYRGQGMLIMTSNFKLRELADTNRLGPQLTDRLAEPPSCVEDLEGFSFRQVRTAYKKKQESI